MDLVGKSIIHKSYGKGIISKVDDKYFYITFNSVGTKQFGFTKIFHNFITVEETAAVNEIDKIIKNAEEETERKSKENVAEMERQRELLREQEKPKPRTVKPTTRTAKSTVKANIAFKCNYCDGGKSDKQVGYDGVCSDKIIHNNIIVEKRTWCGSSESVCVKYHSGEISRQELDDMCNDDTFVCYESRMLRDWKALAGLNIQSETKTKARIIKGVRANSLCILTTRDPKHSEVLRYIFAVFLVDESYAGDGRDEGYVTTMSEFKIKLSPVEARSLRFWNYYKNEGNSQLIRWSSGLYRYLDDEQAARILKDIATTKKNTDDEDLAVRFYKHYCTINKIDESPLTKE
jgi:uncharacterized protein YdcH (DUF465 family)